MSRYGLIGEHLLHSFSSELHRELNNAEYELIEIPRERIGEWLSEADFKGVNVTIPYKQTVMSYCEPDETAAEIGAVNTLINTGEKLLGYNTDCLGFFYLLKRAGILVAGKKVVILGSGGTARTAAYVCRKEGAACILTASRSGKEGTFSYEQPEVYEGTQILINTTPVGMFPGGGECPVDLDRFPDLEAVVDVVYNPLRTLLIRRARERGLPASGGLPMLVSQAWYAERLFHGETIDEAMESRAEAELEPLIEKISRDKQNIVLIGMPGSGKTMNGKLLAEKLDRKFVDTDEILAEEQGMTPGEFIRKYGETVFRDREAEIIARISVGNHLVISVGGGAVLRKSNVQDLRSNGCLIRLKRPVSELDFTGRPLSGSREALEEMYRERDPIYREAADLEVNVGETTEETTERILQVLNADLREMREEIDRIDGEMAVLFEKRMQTVSRIAGYKKLRGLPVTDTGREEEMLKKRKNCLEDPKLAEYYIRFLKGQMELSREYQRSLISGQEISN